MSKTIRIELTGDAALVLFEYLTRIDSGDAAKAPHEAEERVLWFLEGQLERALTEPLDPNYRELLAKAQRRVRSGTD